MIIPKFNLRVAIDCLRRELINTGRERPVTHWQSEKLEGKAKGMIECFDVTFKASIPERISRLQEEVKPNLPWADLQFAERVSGEPLNPGESYKRWPYYKMDETMRPSGFFSHTYMERFWPRYANSGKDAFGNFGIRGHYGDLGSVIKQLKYDPYTRQAYLPIFFPEDTGNQLNVRVPCSLGYLFYIVENYLHITYYIRSCDYIRHLRDDIYMACLLNHYVALKLLEVCPGIQPGYLIMHIANLHIFSHELKLIENESTNQNGAISTDSPDHFPQSDLSKRESGGSNY